jgi:hypothetical protein
MAKPFGIWRLGALPASILAAALVGVAVALAAHAIPQVSTPESLISAVALAPPVQPLVRIPISGWVGISRVVPAA